MLSHARRRQYALQESLPPAELQVAATRRIAEAADPAISATAKAAAEFVALLEPPVECAVCRDTAPATKGIRCRAAAAHFVCDECFDGYVRRWVTGWTFDCRA